MRILITGSAGFIGSHLTERFLKEGFEVIGIDNLLTGSRDNMVSFLNHSNFSFIEDSVEESKIEGNFTHIIHIASPASPKDYLKYPMETMKVNTLGTWRLLEKAREKNSTFIFASTSEIYGDPLEHPQKEEYWGNVNPAGPRSVYDESKRFGEALCASFVREFGLDARIARIFNTYGPRMKLDDGRVIPTFIISVLKNKRLPIYGNGHQTRSFCYIDDMVESLFLLTVGENLKGTIINVGNPQEMEILELAEIIIEITGSKSGYEFKPLPQDDPKRRCPDITLAKKLLNWEPKTSIKEGLVKMIEYFRNEL